MSLEFDGVDDFVDIAENVLFPLSAITICFWVKSTSLATEARVLSKWSDQSGTPREWFFDINTDGTLTFEQNTVENGFDSSIGHAGDITSGDWHFVVGVQGASQVGHLHLDDDVKTFSGGSTGTLVDTVAPVRMGSQGHIGIQDPFTGELEDIRIYNRVLTSLEYEAIYNGGRGAGSEWTA